MLKVEPFSGISHPFRNSPHVSKPISKSPKLVTKKTAKTREILLEFAVPGIWDFYIENKANRCPGFQSFSLEFSNKVRPWYGE